MQGVGFRGSRACGGCERSLGIGYLRTVDFRALEKQILCVFRFKGSGFSEGGHAGFRVAWAGAFRGSALGVFRAWVFGL